MRRIIRQNKENIMYNHIGITEFNGCQCFKDCTCHEDFEPTTYDYYTVKRGNKKTTTHQTLEDANVRWDFINNL